MPDAIDKLTAAVAAGDDQAVETFYRRYFDSLYAMARRATRRDEAFCLDVVQESVFRILRSIRAVETEAKLMAWLRLVVRTTAYDLLRSENRRLSREAVFALAARNSAPADPAECEVADDSVIAWLRQEIERLDPMLIRIIELRFEKRWTLARIGQLFGLSTGTVDGRLRRALGGLRLRAESKLSEQRDV